MNLANAIKHLYPNANPLTDYALRDDSNGKGPYIEMWNLGPMPTADELHAASDAYDIESVKIKTVSMRQARLALLQSGILDQINAAITAMPSPQRESVLIEWEYAATVERNSPLVAGLAASLSLTEDQLDGLFEIAVTL